ncbi:RNA-binding protein [Falsiroseomonas bella]|uniref:RNA-binding protein n=1 Tax=Falsiroseomonas bella TaxID=2184016 RepID=A0A317FEV3_9PROT|nr:ASCH domain-containing protein [Falsiroseomonas bella]PWS36469.1 RNA-binding protein [Falsiroseomonas bella]
MQDHRHDILEAAFPGESGRFFLSMRIGGTPDLADYGAALILDGTKTATSSPFSDYPDGRIPFAGALSVLLDGRERPVGIVETTGVETVRFRDVTEAMARAYGEGERTLAWWRREIGAWYRDKADHEGWRFSEHDAILWEWINVARRLQPGGATP